MKNKIAKLIGWAVLLIPIIGSLTSCQKEQINPTEQYTLKSFVGYSMELTPPFKITGIYTEDKKVTRYNLVDSKGVKLSGVADYMMKKWN
jgi:hypothetical protein